MIGQTQLINMINDQIESGVYPRFSILVGPVGSGKKTLADMIPSMFNGTDYTYTLPDIKVDTIRKMIEDAYKVNTRTFFIILDADTMSVAAKNALLKVTEEPPNNAYFIMTLQDIANTLPTIKSRGTVFHMEPYTSQNIGDYYTQTYDADLNDIVLDICETPGEVDTLKSLGIYKFYEYVETVVDNIAEVSGANSFKISNKIAFKSTDEDKFDLPLFWKTFSKVCVQRLRDAPLKYAHGIKVTSKYLQELKINGVNKQSTFDMWLLDIREVWR